MKKQKAVIVGASHAAAQLSVSLRQQGWQGDILMIGDEPHLPYHRPPLSKSFLSADQSIDDLLIRPAAFYEKNNIQFYHGRVLSINRQQQKLLLADGSEQPYDKLALCLGARARSIELAGSQLSGIYSVRHAADVTAMKAQLRSAKNAVIIGGGYIGLETASALRQQGINVVVLEMAERILQRVTAPELSDFYSRVHAEEGVAIHTGISITEIIGTTQVEAVSCSNGMIFPADFVVLGVGVHPNTALAEDAGILINNGIVVDDHCRTNDPNIVAAGDCTNHFNTHYKRHIRLESVPNANEQAKVAAASICGLNRAYKSLPWFWSDQYDLKLQIAGLSQGYDQLVIRGDQHVGRSFAAFYFKNDQLIAADCVNRPQEFMLSKKVISEKIAIHITQLIDESVSIKDMLQRLSSR